ncbi:MAG: hypothetical protein GAK33_07438 [Burkholderia lata]|uniref:Uncharacterized protein n=1 Tax=Burkholderia lata (strain ATCC 17760 / DSM 23089 / LMG 22485 / NCIMB 9086 / R18194 / 383) TaxID=482957 RepID=A0A833PGG3_BURL3|nr:MAG: hypothetical protein GAK33_07438 [Burkholderia lata]
MSRKTHAARINIGIGDKDRKKIAEGRLKPAHADSGPD